MYGHPERRNRPAGEVEYLDAEGVSCAGFCGKGGGNAKELSTAAVIKTWSSPRRNVGVKRVHILAAYNDQQTTL